MSITTWKKIAGTVGFGLVLVGRGLSNTDVGYVVSSVGGLLALWGQHPLPKLETSDAT